MENKETTKRIYFEHLDVVRFVAAFMIVIAHSFEGWRGWYGELGFLTNGTYKAEDLTETGKHFNQFISNFGMGVDVFFLMSGFLITYILLEEKKRFNKIFIGKFIIRRTLRIWPLYFLLIFLSPFIVQWTGSTPEPNYLANAFFVGNFDMMYIRNWIYPFAHFWSICVEEHFYIVWPFIIYFTPRKKMLPVFISIILISIIYRIYVFTTMDESYFNIYLNTLSRMDTLVIGALGALYYATREMKFKLPRMVRYTLYFILFVCFARDHVYMIDSILEAGFKKYFYILIIGVLMLDYNFNPKFKHFLPKKSIIHYFGKISYGIYMYSNILIVIIIKKIMWEFDIHNLWIYMFLNISLSILIPILSYELFEKHFLKLTKRFRVVKTDR